MRRRAAIIAASAAAAIGGGLLLAPQAQAEPSLCLDVSVDINGQGGAESLCLPPEGGAPAPELPGLPTLP